MDKEKAALRKALDALTEQVRALTARVEVLERPPVAPAPLPEPDPAAKPKTR